MMCANIHSQLALFLALIIVKINPVVMATTTLPTSAQTMRVTTTISTSNTTGMSQQNATTTSQMSNMTTTPPTASTTTTDKMFTFTETEFNILIGVSVAIVVLLLILAAMCGCWSGSQRRRHRRRIEKRVTYYQPVEDDLPPYKDEEFYQPDVKNDTSGDIFIPYNGKPMAALNTESSPSHTPYNVPYSPYLFDDRFGNHRNGAFDRPYRSNLEVKAKRTDKGWMLSAPSLHHDLPRVWI